MKNLFLLMAAFVLVGFDDRDGTQWGFILWLKANQKY